MVDLEPAQVFCSRGADVLVSRHQVVLVDESMLTCDVEKADLIMNSHQFSYMLRLGWTTRHMAIQIFVFSFVGLNIVSDFTDWLAFPFSRIHISRPHKLHSRSWE